MNHSVGFTIKRFDFKVNVNTDEKITDWVALHTRQVISKQKRNLWIKLGIYNLYSSTTTPL